MDNYDNLDGPASTSILSNYLHQQQKLQMEQSGYFPTPGVMHELPSTAVQRNPTDVNDDKVEPAPVTVPIVPAASSVAATNNSNHTTSAFQHTLPSQAYYNFQQQSNPPQSFPAQAFSGQSAQYQQYQPQQLQQAYQNQNLQHIQQSHTRDDSAEAMSVSGSSISAVRGGGNAFPTATPNTGTSSLYSPPDRGTPKKNMI
jgi:hypothetical protein